MTDGRTSWGNDGLRTFNAAPQAPLFDPELGQIFIKMRTLLGVSLWDMARAVGGEPTVIANLEAGAVDALPEWPELTRLVDAYAALTGIDPQPILARLLQSQPQVLEPIPSSGQGSHEAQPHANLNGYVRTGAVRDGQHAARPPYADQAMVAPAGRQVAPAPVGRTTANSVDARDRRVPASQRSYINAPALASAAEVVEPRTSPSRPIPGAAASRVRRAARSLRDGLGLLLRRRTLMAFVLLAVPVLVVLTARLLPGVLYGAISPLPAVFGAPLRNGIDAVVATMAPVRDGLTWIDVGDPSLRKTDKLRETGR